MKKQLIITSLALLTLLGVGLGIHYLLSLHKVTFTIDKEVEEIVIYNAGDKDIKRLSSDDKVLLRAGKYYAVPAGENIVTDKIQFSVEDKDVAVDIQPPYTSEFLADILKDEAEAIRTAVVKKYPSALNEYSLVQESLYKRGEWFGGLLAPKVNNVRDKRDPYRIVLHKKDGSWNVIRRPEYILTSSRYNEVPIEVLRQINTLIQSPDA